VHTYQRGSFIGEWVPAVPSTEEGLLIPGVGRAFVNLEGLAGGGGGVAASLGTERGGAPIARAREIRATGVGGGGEGLSPIVTRYSTRSNTLVPSQMLSRVESNCLSLLSTGDSRQRIAPERSKVTGCARIWQALVKIDASRRRPFVCNM